MPEHLALINQFYQSFQQRDYEGMIACYHDEVHFSDPVFTDLKGSQAKAMWHMLCERGKDLQVVYGGVEANNATGRANWEATYTFATGRKVHNVIAAAFTFKDGLIYKHQDSFDLWQWTRMALGPTGTLLGWSPPIQNKVRQTALKGLQTFIEKHPEYQ